MTTYRYKPLASREVRLLVLHPGKSDDEIHVSLKPYKFSGTIFDPSIRPTSLDVSLGPPVDSKGAMVFPTEGKTPPTDLVGHLAMTRIPLGSSGTYNVDFYLEDYEALSYVWGQPGVTSLLSVHALDSEEEKEGNHEGFISVTTNLAVALRALRCKDKKRVFWVDAVCIDQSNIMEKNGQVPLMGLIYRMATKTIIWLGQESDDSETAMDLLAKIASDFSDVVQQSTHFSERYLTDAVQKLDLNREEIVALCSLFARPWFTRLWTRQELFVSRHSVIICGAHEISWSKFFNTVFITSSRLHNAKDTDDLPPAWKISVDRAVAVCQGNARFVRYNRLRYVLHPLNWSQPHDAVYAVRNMLATHDYGIPIQPDYTRSVADVFEEVAAKLVSDLQTLDFLSTCELHPSSPSNLPSWVPDWSTSMKVQHEFEYPWSACSWMSSHARYISEERFLSVTGVDVGQINKVFTHQLQNHHNSDQLISPEAVFDHLKHLNSTDQTVDGELAKTFARALVACERLDDERDNPSRPSGLTRATISKSLVEIWSSDTMEQAQERDPHVSGFLSACANSLIGRNVFTTQEGHVGLAPVGALLDDHIWVLPGSKYPIALRRPEDHSSSQWRVVGGCFVPGIMAGETIHGPLPSHWQPVFNEKLRSDEIDGYDVKLKRNKDAAFSSTSPFPLSPYELDRPLDPDDVFREKGIRVGRYERSTWGKHRLPVTPEALRQAGVKLEELFLV